MEKKRRRRRTRRRPRSVNIYIYIEFINTNKKNIIYMVVINKIVIKYIY